MDKGIVSLPMYDWPELNAAHDIFHDVLKQQLRDRGFDAPDNLSRTQEIPQMWLSENLILSQTCGMPFVTALKDRVSLVGTPDYDIAGEPGDYHSVIIVHRNSDVQSLADLAGKTFVYNEQGSQSGYASVAHAMTSVGLAGMHSFHDRPSGSHRQSIKAVAAGVADFAAIDAVTWEIAKRFETASGSVRVLAQTDPTPGLPFITASHRTASEVDKIFEAAAIAIDSLDQQTRQSLFLNGLIKTEKKDYQVIEGRILNSRSGYFDKYG